MGKESSLILTWRSENLANISSKYFQGESIQLKCWQGFLISKLVSENSPFLFMQEPTEDCFMLTCFPALCCIPSIFNIQLFVTFFVSGRCMLAWEDIHHVTKKQKVCPHRLPQ